MSAILHISDLHFGRRSEEIFGDKLSLARSIAQAVAEHWEEAQKDRCLVVSGDLIYKGNQGAYEQARRFIEDLRTELLLEPHRVIVCPGNHDIVAGSDPFGPINLLIHRVTLALGRTFARRTSYMADLGDVEMLVFNSVFNGKYGYGYVDLSPGATPALEKPRTLRVAVVHHNLLGIHEDDKSALRNGYPFLSYLAQNGVQLVLHGHQHAWQDLPAGTLSIRLVGAGSLNFRNPGGTANQFNLVVAREGDLRVIRYVWDTDSVAKTGVRGDWVPTG